MAEFETKPKPGSATGLSGAITSSVRESVLPWAMPQGSGGHPPIAAPTGNTHRPAAGVSELFGNYADHEGPRSPHKSDAHAADPVLKGANQLLDPKAKHADAGKDATAAMQLLNKLPPAQQTAAMGKMSDEDFQRLITHVPKDKREQFESLFRNCADPERKLQLWGEFHKSKVQNDVQRKHESASLADAALNSTVDRRNHRREDIAKSTDAEVDEEMKHLRDQMKAGQPVTAADIDMLAERKELEHSIEFKHLVNLTNDVDTRGTPNAATTRPRERATWSKYEMMQLASGLDRLPEDATTNNPMLKEIRRSKTNKDFDAHSKSWVDDPRTGGDHGNGVITLFDTSMTGRLRHTGQTSELADHRATGAIANGRISPLEEAIVHEVGHDIHDLHPEAMAKLQATTGWANVADNNALKAKLMATDMSEADANAQISKVDGQRANSDGAEGITIDGITYKNDPYRRGGYQSHTQGAIPQGKEWEYARTNYKDHFAELYTKAIHVPEHLHRDLIEQPKKNVESKQSDQQELADRLKMLKDSGQADPRIIAKLEADAKEAQVALDQAKREEQMYGEQWRIMREDVFHLDDARVDASAKALEGRVPKGKEKKAAKLQAEFKKKAEMAATPAQLDQLEKQYQQRIESL